MHDVDRGPDALLRARTKAVLSKWWLNARFHAALVLRLTICELATEHKYEHEHKHEHKHKHKRKKERERNSEFHIGPEQRDDDMESEDKNILDIFKHHIKR